MADLLDIAPSTSCEAVKLGGQRLVVRGLHADAVASIVSRFPELGMLIGGLGADVGSKLIARFGQAIGPIIAAGCGHLGDEKYEQHAGTLLLDHQLKLVTAIIGLTFPNGFTAIGDILTALAGKQEKPVKMRLRKSPSASLPSSDAGSLPTLQ
jgi:hypothetical protein